MAVATLLSLVIQCSDWHSVCVDLDELRRLNAGTVINDFLSVGQEVIISGTPLTVAPTATPETQSETPVEATEPAPVETPDPAGSGNLPAAPTGNTASLCVLAYYDANNDMFRQADASAGEMALPNAEITLVGMSGPAGTYRTDGISEPYCFQNLEPGNYILRHTPPSGYTLTDTGQWNIPLSAGQVSSLNLGYARDESAAEPGTPQQQPESPEATEAAPEEETEKPGGITRCSHSGANYRHYRLYFGDCVGALLRSCRAGQRGSLQSIKKTGIEIRWLVFVFVTHAWFKNIPFSCFIIIVLIIHSNRLHPFQLVQSVVVSSKS